MAGKYSAVLTAKQERQAGASSATVWYTSGNSGKDLWKLKANNPELFKNQGNAGSDALPPGFEETDKIGWYYNRADKIFFVTSSRKFLWFDEETGEHKELYEGQTMPLTFSGGAASLSEANGGKAPAPKTVVIPDLHRVASALKMDLSHIDKPAAMLGVFGGETAARGFHEKLVKRLGMNRSRWLDHQLTTALEDTLQDVLVGPTVPVSVVLVTGQRACAVATEHAAFHLALRQAHVASIPTSSASSSSTPRSKAKFLNLKEGDALYVAASVGGASGSLEKGFEEILAPQLAKGWARTGAISFLHSLRAKTPSALEPLAIASARLYPREVSTSSEAPAAKRLKVSSSPIFAAGTAGAGSGKADQVRLRQILLRMAPSDAANKAPITDPIRRTQVKRTQEEAEKEMLEILQNLEADGMKSFQKVCRDVSQCPSALKGGDLAGDMGWLDRVKGVGIQQDKAKQGVRPQVPSAVLKAAFELDVGEVHDLVTTEIGVHLLQRTA